MPKNLRDGDLAVVTAVDGPAPATHLIRHRDGVARSFFLAVLRSYRLVIELLDPLARRPSLDRVLARFEVTGDEVSPEAEGLVSHLVDASEAIGADTFAGALGDVGPEDLVPLRRNHPGASASFQLVRTLGQDFTESEPVEDNDVDSLEVNWLLTVFEAPYHQRTTQMRSLRCRTPWRKRVWSSSWDGGFPGMSGFDEVWEVDGRFFYRDDDGSQRGPFDTLSAALPWEGAIEVSALNEIESTAFRSSEIAQMLIPSESLREGATIQINGQLWEHHGGVFRRVK